MTVEFPDAWMQEPPWSLRDKAVMPFPDSTTRSRPLESNLILLGFRRPEAIIRAVYPGAIEGAEYLAEMVGMPEHDCATVDCPSRRRAMVVRSAYMVSVSLQFFFLGEMQNQ